jgi:protein TonB
MPTAINGYTGARAGSGLLITAAVHVALGAALLSLGVVEIPLVVTQPIKLRPVPDTTQPVDEVEPVVRDDRIAPLVDAPVIDIAIDLPRPADTAARGGDVVPDLPPDRGPIVRPPTPAPSVLVSARLDPRYAAIFQPPYPPASERREEEGVVTVRVHVGTDGRVLSAELKASSGHRRLDEAAVERARRAWRFVPATRDGVAIESWREVPVRFELKNG